jgi:hypothetical protein
MYGRLLLKLLLPFHGPIDLAPRHNSFFHQTMRDNNNRLTAEEVQYPILQAPMADPELIDPVTKIIGFRTTQFMA